MSKLITLPSGLSGEVRGLKGREGKILTSKEVQKAGNLMERVLAACWLKTTDPGPYPFISEGEASPDWTRVLTGDILVGVLEVRELSFGSKYPFKTQCTSDGCRHSFEWEVDLEDIVRQPLPDSSKPSISAGNRFPAKFASDGMPIEFNLVTAAASQKMNQRMRQLTNDQMLISSLASRLVSIDGNEDKKTFRKILEEREFADLTTLLEDMDAADCGATLELDIECPQCEAVWEVRLPLGQDFFMPVRRKRRTKAQDDEI